jgi:hypothetical protein
MPFDAANLRALAFAHGLTIWHYDATDDAPPTAAGHFDPAAGLLRRGDLIFWSQTNGATKQTGLLLVAEVEPDGLVIEALDSGSAEVSGGLRDVLITAAEAGQVLTFDGQVWINQDPIGVSGDAHSNVIGNPHRTTAADVGAIDQAEKGAAGGVASLDADGTVPVAQLPQLSGGKVDSVFGRTGAVTAKAGDYTADQIADSADKVLMTAAERTKLASIEDGAAANPPPVTAAERTAGSGTQPRTFAPADVGEMAKLHAPVGSVAGKTGAVTLNAADVGAAAAGHVGSGGGAHAVAAAGAAGFMSAADKTKLDAVQPGAQVNPPVMSDAQAVAGSDRTPRTPSAAQLKLAAQTWGGGSGGSSSRSIVAPAGEDPAISLELPSAVNRRNFLLAFTATGAVTTTKSAQAADVDRLVAEAPAALANLSQLKAARPPACKAVILLGRTSPGDGGGGTFYWDEASTEAEDGGTIFAPAAGGTGRWKRVTDGQAVNVRWFGAKGDGIADDTAAIQAALNSINNNIGVAHVNVWLDVGTYKIASTLICNQKSMNLYGSGLGNPSNYAPNPGRGSTLIWGGPAGSPMLRIFDSAYLDVSDIMFLGNATNKPSAAISFLGAGSIGTNTNLRVRRCRMGSLPWSGVAPGKRVLGAGILFEGPNANNDQFRIDDCQICDCDVGLDITNTQSVWGINNNCEFAQCGKGIRTAASTKVVNAQFWNCGTDIETLSTARVLVDGWWSENSYEIFNVTELSAMAVRGGRWAIQTEMQGASHIGTAPTLSENLSIVDVYVLYQITPKPPIHIRGSWSKPYTITIKNCGGIDSLSLLDIAGYAAPDITYVDIDTAGVRINRTITGSGLGTSPFQGVGKLGVSNSASATTPGTVVRKIEVFDGRGSSLGFLPVYKSIA